MTHKLTKNFACRRSNAQLEADVYSGNEDREFEGWKVTGMAPQQVEVKLKLKLKVRRALFDDRLPLATNHNSRVGSGTFSTLCWARMLGGRGCASGGRVRTPST
jgi:hypothetical protein